jgi:hypothetical protein
MMEEHLRRAMLMAKGDPTVFVTRPISLAFIGSDVDHRGRHGSARHEEAARRDYRIAA